ncbi:NAD-dependent epimerase/dehydratase family protein [Eubacteriaceae bacterium ES3]|nr:NAD-dependent epimerase/dehydratase family protein [Eubacteriaceae bacterium ES3]
MKKRIFLLTGATGLLGGNIVRALVESCEEVHALVMPGDPAVSKMPENVEIIEGDLLDSESLEQFFYSENEADLIVIHAAGLVTLDPKPNENVRAVNVDGTKNIVEKCLKYKVKKLVYISSTSVIPELPHGQLISEVDSFNEDLVIGYYAKTKTMATKIVMEAVRNHNLDASIVFPSGIFGPNDYSYGLITSSVIMFAQGKIKISIGGTFNSVDARDLAHGVIACAQKGRKGEGYIMANRCYTFKQLIVSICDAAGIKRPRFNIPLLLLRPYAGLGGLYGKLTRTPSWFSHFTIYNLERNNNYDTQKAEAELGFICRTLNESIIDTVVWLKDVGKLK